MFPQKSTSTQFGFWDVVVPILSSTISTAGSIAAARIQSSAAKDVAKIQAGTAQATILAQERLAQLQLESLRQQTASLNTSNAMRVTPETVQQPATIYAGVSQVNWAYLALGGALLILLLNKKR